MSQGNGDSGGLSKRTIHEVYVGVILVAAIVILAAVKWYQIDRLVELISFALTISSLVLAIMAIGYSIFSGTGIERSVGNLLTAVSSIRSSATDMDALRTVLSNDIRALGDAIGSIATTVTSQSGMLAALAEGRAASEAPQIPGDAVATVRLTDTKYLLDRGSMLGGHVVLAVARCRERKTAIDIAKAAEGTSLDLQYLLAYLVALSAGKVISIRYKGGLEVLSVEEDLGLSAIDIKANVLARIDAMDIIETSKRKFIDELMLFDGRLRGITEADAAASATAAENPNTPQGKSE